MDASKNEAASHDTTESTMEIALRAPKLHWRAVQHRYPNSRRKPKQDKPDDLPTAEQVRCTATLAEQERQLPCTLELPASDTKEYEEFLEMRVTFDVYSKYGGEKLISTYSLSLRGCVPVLTEAKVSWSEGVAWNQVRLLRSALPGAMMFGWYRAGC